MSKINASKNSPREIPKFDSDISRLDWFKEHCSWPKIYYGNVEQLIRLSDARKVMEIGVAYGYHAESLLKALPLIEYIGIDPYMSGYDANDEFPNDVAELFDDESQKAMDRLYESVLVRLSQYGPRATLIRSTSQAASNGILNGSLDLIFIDGDHRYEVVSREVKDYWEKLKVGGILAGDDYNWPDVKRAVDEFFVSHGVMLSFLSREAQGYATWFALKTT